MTANVSLEQFAHLKQPACDYLAQGYEISHKLTDLIEALKELLSMVEKYTKSGLSPKSSVLSDAEKKATELANQIDAEVNLLNLYNGIGNTKEEIERKMKDSSKLKSLFSQINDAVKDAKDDSSGYTKEILVLFMDPTLKNLKQAIKKIK